MQHLHKEQPTRSEIEALIKWSETTNIEIKQCMRIIEQTSWRTSDAINKVSAKWDIGITQERPTNEKYV
jgi:hypothetical protein